MAELKYDLSLINTKSDERRIYNQPWYKERLRTKYLKALNEKDAPQLLNVRNWTFIKDGLDDFRDGLPPLVEGGIMLGGQKGLSPNIKDVNDSQRLVKQTAMKNRFTKEEVCFSKTTPLQQQRRDHIGDIEYGLTQHPLALYPHLEESMPAEVFEDVVDILDPEMNIASEDEDQEYTEEEETESQFSPQEQPVPSQRKSPSETEKPTAKNEVKEEVRVRNPYRWLNKRDDKEDKDKKDKKKNSDRRNSPSQDEHIKTVTKEFCDWVSGLGGESNNIEESTITSLFASGYETKPALSVPIHVVELSNVPPELRASANVPPPPQRSVQNIPTVERNSGNWAFSGQGQPNKTKYKYGAWYLHPKTWKKLPADLPLQDPKEEKNDQESENKKKEDTLNNELAELHGASAFMDFINKKSSRRPEFLEKVSDIQDKKIRETQNRSETDIAKQRRLRDKGRGPELSATENH